MKMLKNILFPSPYGVTVIKSMKMYTIIASKGYVSVPLWGNGN